MKTTLAILAFVLAMVEAGHSQNVNWRALSEDKPNVVQLNAGYDFGTTVRAGYSRSIALIRPVVVGVDFSLPMGSDLTDDFKVNLGGQMEVLEAEGFSATIKIASIFRRYQSDLVRMVGFGSDLGVVAGYYHPSWYAAGEFGFDKAITSYLKHSDIMRDVYPAITDAWYVPTGGHFYYGIQGGASIGELIDLTVRAGATRAQFNDENAAIPFYFQFGVGTRF